MAYVSNETWIKVIQDSTVEHGCKPNVCKVSEYGSSDMSGIQRHNSE